MASESDSIGLLSFILEIDWYEPWMCGLVVFHIVCALITACLIIYNLQYIQFALFFTFLGLIFASEYINEWAADHYRLFFKQQYFDSKGMFISLLFSTPLLLNALVFVIYWMYSNAQSMIKIKRAKLRAEIKSSVDKTK